MCSNCRYEGPSREERCEHLKRERESGTHHPECSVWKGPYCDCKGLPVDVTEPDGWAFVCGRGPLVS